MGVLKFGCKFSGEASLAPGTGEDWDPNPPGVKGLSFIMFSLFLQLFYCCTIKRDPFVQHQKMTFFKRGNLELETCWPRDKIQDGGEYLCDFFSSKSFHIILCKEATR